MWSQNVRIYLDPKFEREVYFDTFIGAGVVFVFIHDNLSESDLIYFKMVDNRVIDIFWVKAKLQDSVWAESVVTEKIEVNETYEVLFGKKGNTSYAAKIVRIHENQEAAKGK